MREFLAAVGLCLLISGVSLIVAPMSAPAVPSVTLKIVADDQSAALAMLPPPAIKPVHIEPLLPMDAPIGAGWHQASPTLVIVPVPRPAASQRLLAEASRSIGKGSRELGVRRTLWCADAINKWLAAIGAKGTGSALAKSFADWGEAAKPSPGVVGVKKRRGGNHVVVVKAVTASKKGVTILAISPNSRGKVREMKYSVRAFYAFRRPV